MYGLMLYESRKCARPVAVVAHTFFGNGVDSERKELIQDLFLGSILKEALSILRPRYPQLCHHVLAAGHLF